MNMRENRFMETRQTTHIEHLHLQKQELESQLGCTHLHEAIDSARA